MKNSSPILIVFIAFILLLIASFMPLSHWTGGWLKDFNLFSDILKESSESSVLPGNISDADAAIDPELLKIQKEKAESSDTDSQTMESVDADTVMMSVRPSRKGDLVLIEDYTTGGTGLQHLKAKLGFGSLVRIAFVGDSYIEGDIFAQDLREMLQTAYGGQGVGFVNMHSDFPGFRKSVRQGGSGWTTFLANKKADKRYIDLAEQYAMPKGDALSTYKGSSVFSHAKSWSVSRFLFVAPDGAVINFKAGEDEWEERNIEASESVQCIELSKYISDFEVKTSTQNLIALGVWLDGVSGISLDCMSSRGFSGVTLTKVSESLCHEMAKYINYDLIILNFGINAMSAQQKDYSVYSSRMVEVVKHLRACYPQAEVLLLGIGDRGERRGSEVKSMSTAPNMTAAQRDAARKAHCLFWDTREAMGGDGAAAAWSKDRLMNKDYVHLSHKGGARLAEELFNAIQNELK